MLTTFKKFSDPGQAHELEKLLQENGVVCEIVVISSGLDSSFSGQFDKEYIIKLGMDDFAKAETIVEAEAAKWLDEVPADYYLLTFTDDELREVIEKKHEWSEFDYQLAKKILKDRGVVIDETIVKQIHQQHIVQTGYPENLGESWIVSGYLTSFLGGISIFRTIVILSSKKTLPDGRIVYMYKNSDRVHARLMLFISIAVWVVLIAFFVFKK